MWAKKDKKTNKKESETNKKTQIKEPNLSLDWQIFQTYSYVSLELTWNPCLLQNEEDGSMVRVAVPISENMMPFCKQRSAIWDGSRWRGRGGWCVRNVEEDHVMKTSNRRKTDHMFVWAVSDEMSRRFYLFTFFFYFIYLNRKIIWFLAFKTERFPCSWFEIKG